MASISTPLDTAIFTVLNVQTLHTVAPGGVHNGVAPKGTKAPFVVFQGMPAMHDYTFSKRFVDVLYQVKAISESPWPKEASDIDTVIDTILQDASLTITGYSALCCRREQDIKYPEEVNGKQFFHVGGIYRVMADQS